MDIKEAWLGIKFVFKVFISLLETIFFSTKPNVILNLLFLKFFLKWKIFFNSSLYRNKGLNQISSDKNNSIKQFFKETNIDI